MILDKKSVIKKDGGKRLCQIHDPVHMKIFIMKCGKSPSDYSQITQFRVIGKSHDERMIPMVELGKGNTCIFCTFRTYRSGQTDTGLPDPDAAGIRQSLGKWMEDRGNL